MMMMMMIYNDGHDNGSDHIEDLFRYFSCDTVTIKLMDYKNHCNKKLILRTMNVPQVCKAEEMSRVFRC